MVAAIAAAAKQPFACADDAKRQLEQFQGEHSTRFWAVQGSVEAQEVPQKRTRPGRPRKDEEPQKATVFRLKLEPVLQEANLAEAKRQASTFVLITNANEPSARELLETYKGQQTGVEIPFRVLKAFPVSPVFLKDKQRVEALGWVLLMAYLIYAFMQHRVRQAVAQRGRYLVTPGNRKDDRPTGRSILDMLRWIKTVKLRLPDGTVGRYG